MNVVDAIHELTGHANTWAWTQLTEIYRIDVTFISNSMKQNNIQILN